VPFGEITQNANTSRDIVQEVSGLPRVMSDMIKQLYANSEEIGEISQTIAKIARKTQLLSFNATIEAGRAGKAGAG